MFMKYVIFLFGFVLFFAACKKENASPPQLTPAVDPNTIFPNYVHTDSVGQYYIQATFNGKKISLSPALPPRDTFSNAYYLDEKIGLDQLNLIRSNNEGSAEMQMYFGVSHMLTRPIPYVLPRAILEQCEFTQFQFYDSWHRHGVENDASDDYTYQASTNTGMKLTVTSFVDNVIEGTFEGTLRTNTGKIMTVKDGSFKIKIFIINSGE